MAEFSELKGRTIDSISTTEGSVGLSFEGIIGVTEIKFICADGAVYRMYHEQDCCEQVQVEDIAGDLADLMGSPILMAEVETNHNETDDESLTWTFYKLATARGYVTIRWRGESNGYYGEEVDFVRVK